MSCLNSHDSIAYPGFRYVRVFQASTGSSFRTILADCLERSGWSVESITKVSIPNPGSGFKATSLRIPWCFNSEAPADYKMKCRVKFWPRTTFSGALQEDTEFFVMNEDETLVQTTTEVNLRPTIGDYSPDAYIYIGNPYQFFCFMLGTERRRDLAISDSNTAICAGVPQVPKFLQARGSGFCGLGMQECFFLWNLSQNRRNSLRKLGGGYFAGGIAYDDGAGRSGSWFNNNTGNATLHYGISGGGTTEDENGQWLLDLDNLDDPSTWKGLFFPPILSWQSNPAVNIDYMKGFLWDSIIVNKGFRADDKLQFDGHQFIVFNTFDGADSTDPAGALLIATSGAV